MFLQLQKSSMEVSRTKEDVQALQNDLVNADKEISVRRRLAPELGGRREQKKPDVAHHCLSVRLWFTPHFLEQSLKKKVEVLQKTLSTPTRTNEAISRLVFERSVA